MPGQGKGGGLSIQNVLEGGGTRAQHLMCMLGGLFELSRGSSGHLSLYSPETGGRNRPSSGSLGTGCSGNWQALV